MTLALAAMTLLMTLGGALVTLSVTETAIAARHRDGLAALYAAEGALAATMAALRAEADWAVVAPRGEPWRAFADGWVRDEGDGRVAVRAQAARGPGTRRIVEVTVSRAEEGIRVLSWREGP
jgi:hypothetical protein